MGINLAQIGCGYWGPNIIRAALKIAEARLKVVAETDPSRKQFVKRHFPEIDSNASFAEVLSDHTIDGVILATPAASHYSLAKLCLEHNKHVLIEKPFAKKSTEALDLIDLAEKKGKKVMSGHTFLYHDVFQKVKNEYLPTIGELFYLSLRRLNLGRIRSDVNAWWNLAPHDVSILLYFLEEMPSSIAVSGNCFIQKDVEDVVFATLKWANGVTANIHVSWLDPHKVRECTIIGSKKMLVIDDTTDDKLCIHDKGIDKVFEGPATNDYDLPRPNFSHRKGDLFYPAIEQAEPLVKELQAFVHCITSDEEPLSGKNHSLQVVRVLEAGELSLKQGGKPIELLEEAYA
jgi:predicted dehydrogenase